MKREQVIALAVIFVVGLGLYFFGRTTPGPGPDLSTRIGEVLKRHHVPLLAVVDARSAEGRTALKALRGLVARQASGRVELVVVDSRNPNERAALAMVGIRKPPAYIVVGLDGRETYRSVTAVDPAALEKAIGEGLTKPPVKIEEEHGDDHHHH